MTITNQHTAPLTLLRIDASARLDGSVTRDLTDRIVRRLAPRTLLTRDLGRAALPQIDADWVTANFTPAEERSAAQEATLALSDRLVGELEAADTIVVGLPIYNFGVPAALKAWIDLVARAGVTFRYTAEGPRGLLTGKRAILAVASGGTEADSAIDFATPYMRHALGFIGIDDVEVIAADRLMADGPEKTQAARERIDALAA